MGRLPPGTEPTPHKIRLQKYRTELEESGGRRLIADIEAPANAALQKILECAKPSSGDPEKDITLKDAVSQALIHYAKTLRRRRT